MKVLSSETINNQKEVLINNLIASIPQSDYDILLDSILRVNDKIPLKILNIPTGSTGTPVERNNPKVGFTILSCLTSEFDDAVIPVLQNNSYQRLMVNLMTVYKGSKKYITKLQAYKGLTPNQLAQRKVIWDKSYFLTIEGLDKPLGTNSPKVTYDNKISNLTFSNSYLDLSCVQIPKIRGGLQILNQTETLCTKYWKVSANNVPLDPYDIVTFTNRSDISMLEGATPSKCYDRTGSIIACQHGVPAFFLKYASDKQWTADAFRAVETGFDALILAIPVSELIWLGKELNAIYKVSDYAGKYGSAINVLNKNIGIIDQNSELGKALISTGQSGTVLNLVVALPLAATNGTVKLITKGQLKDALIPFYKAEDDLYKAAKDGIISADNLDALQRGKVTLENMAKDAGLEKYIEQLKYTAKSATNTLELSKPDKLADLFYKNFRELTQSNTSSFVFSDRASGILAHLESFNGQTVLAIDKTAALTDNFKNIVRVYEDVVYYEKIGTELVQITEDLVIIEKADGTLACVKGACFIAGTLVHTTEGLKPIEQIQANDQVKSFDEVMQTNTWQKVKRTFKKTTEKLIKVIAGKDTIFATPEHPFYIVNEVNDGSKQGSWTYAGSLKTGLKVLLTGGLLASVSELQAIDSFATVYNFEVEKTHTYYVGTEGILVHNQCGVGALKQVKNALTESEWSIFQDLLINAKATTAERLVFYKELAKLDDVTLKSFFNDFKVGDLAFKRGLIKEIHLIDVWKNVKYLIFSKYDIEFLKWLDKAKKSHLPTHLVGEINASGNAVGCHLQSAIDNIRVKILPTPPPLYVGSELKTAKIEINGVAKKALSSFFPQSWDEARVLEEVALIIKNPTNQVGTNIRLYKGLASDGITNIEIRMTGSSNNLIFDTAFPF